VTKGSVKPNATDSLVEGLLHDLSRHAGMRGDNDTIKIARYAEKVWIALCPFHL
jgi:hypothetical protein